MYFKLIYFLKSMIENPSIVSLTFFKPSIRDGLDIFENTFKLQRSFDLSIETI